MKKITVFLLSVCMMLSSAFATAVSAAPTKPEDRVYVTLETADEYADYLKSHKDAQKQYEKIIVDAALYTSTTMTDIKVLENYNGSSGASLYTSENGEVEWTFDIKKSGLYSIKVEYYPIEGRSSSIQRSIYIDGKLPFEYARNVTFSRVWQDAADEDGVSIKFDRNGNHIRPEQIEAPVWRTQFVCDRIGYEADPLEFYFDAGIHTIRFISEREPMVIKSITLCQPDEAKPYAELEKEYKANGFKSGKGEAQRFQAEITAQKSDSTIIPSSDRSSASIDPSSPSKSYLNVLGGTYMQQNGQWVTWNFTVPESGLYKITLRAVQNTSNGSVSSRKFYIDGKVPCSELESVAFPYSTRWKSYTLGSDGEDFAFYLEAGKTHELKMEVVLGETAPLIKQVSDVVDELNSIYRSILVVTGPTPDTNRDFQFKKIMPEVLENLENQGKLLEEIYGGLSEFAGMSGENVQILAKLYRQIETMCEDPEKIADNFSAFQSNITSLASWVSSARSQPLTVDYFTITPADEEVNTGGASVFKNIAYHTLSFISSFTEDYNNIDYDGKENSVKVWVGSGMTGGRDQAQILKSLINNYFTPKSGIGVNVSLVSMGALLPATLADKGPDVALSLASSEVANYAFRNAAEDISRYNGFDEVKKQFNESALKPISFEGGVYGLPETQTYPVMFYRKDILSELNIDIPQTWEDVIRILPILQKKQLNFGLPSASGNGSTMTAFTMLLYQHGGELYSSDSKKSTLNTKAGLEAFSFLTSLYNDYDLDKVLDFSNRFRSGSVPIAIADYSSYNQLSVFAPELDGLWDFTTVPGIKNSDGVIDRSVPTGVAACMMLTKSKNKTDAWEFMKWWCSSDIQVKFGRELESVMGSAARYPTANLEAMSQIPWSEKCFETIKAQGEWSKAIPEVPGSYYTPRYVDFAFRDVVNKSYDAGEALAEAEKSINYEINNKRREFGLPVDGD